MGVEEGAVDGDAVALHDGPGGGVAVHGGDRVFELVVEAGGFGVLRVGVLDGPAGGVLGAGFHPPSVKDGERRDAVEGGLHAGGSGGFVGAAGGVDPDVDSLGEERAELPVVVFEVDDLDGGAVEVSGGAEDVANGLLARVVGGM